MYENIEFFFHLFYTFNKLTNLFYHFLTCWSLSLPNKNKRLRKSRIQNYLKRLERIGNLFILVDLYITGQFCFNWR